MFLFLIIHSDLRSQDSISLNCRITNEGNMKTITSLLILLCVLITVSEAQELSKVLIKGRIIDNDTRKPIFNANVFLANTTIGTYTDEKGEFLIKNIPLGNYNIVFSFFGLRDAG